MSLRPYKSYSGDPYWMNAKYAGTDAKGNKFEKGARIFYFPKGKQIFTGADAEREAAAFESAAADEAFMMGEY